jgi:hypothetical protein
MSIKVKVGKAKFYSKAEAIRHIVEAEAAKGTPLHLLTIAKKTKSGTCNVSTIVKQMIADGIIPKSCAPVRGRPTEKKTKTAKAK